MTWDFNPFEDEQDSVFDTFEAPQKADTSEDEGLSSWDFNPFEDENVSQIQIAETAEAPEHTEYQEDPTMVGSAMEFAQEKMLEPTGKGLAGGLTGLAGAVGVGMSMFSTAMGDEMVGKEFIKGQGEMIREFWKDFGKKFSMEEYDINPLDRPEVLLDPGYALYNIYRQAPTLVAGFLSGGTAAGLVGGAQIMEQSYNQMKEEGASDEAAAATAATNAVVGGFLEKIGAKFLFEEGGKFLLRITKGGAGELVTEFSQELQGALTQQAMKGLDDGKTSAEIWTEMVDGLGEKAWDALGAGVVGGLIGVPVSGVAGSRKTATELKKEKEKVKEEIERATFADAVKVEYQNADPGEWVAQEQTSPVTDNIKDEGSRIALERGEPTITISADGVASRVLYNAEGRNVGTVRLPEAKHLLKTAGQQESVQKRIPVTLEGVLTKADELVESGADIETIVDQMTELSKRTIVKSAEESAQILDEALGAQPEPKSARDSAEVFEENRAQQEALVAEAEAGTLSAEQVASQLISDEVAKGAEDSFGVFTADTQAKIVALDEAMKTAQEGNQEQAIKDIKKAVQRKGKSAEKSAKYFETPSTQRVAQARSAYAKAVESGDPKAERAASDELHSALKAVEKTEKVPTPKEPTVIKREPETPAPRKTIQPEGEIIFDEATGTPVIPTASPETVLEREQEAPAQETLQPIPQKQDKAVDVPIQEKIQEVEGRDLVQSILDSNPDSIDKALQKFPVAERSGAYQRASKDAIELSRDAGVYDIKATEQNIEDNKGLAAQRREGESIAGVKVKSDPNVPGIWSATESASGNTYSIYKYNNDYIVQKDGTQETSIHNSYEAAAKSIASKSKGGEYSVVDSGNKGQNRWEVHGPDGVIDPGKLSGGLGYKTKKTAQAKVNQLNKAPVAKSTKKVTKKSYKDSATDYAKGKGEKATKKTTSKKPQKRVVVTRKTIPSIKGQVDEKTQQEASSGVKQIVRRVETVVKKLDDLTINPFQPTEKDTPTTTELKRIGNSIDFINKHGDKSLKDTLSILEQILPEGVLSDVRIDLVQGSSPINVPGRYNPVTKEVEMYSENVNGDPYSTTAFSRTLLHEMVHAVTYEKLQYNPEIRNELDDLRWQIAQTVLSTRGLDVFREYEGRKNAAHDFNQFINESFSEGLSATDIGFDNQSEVRVVYSLLNNDELLANSTHPVVRDYFEQVKVDNKKVEGLMDKVKAIFKRLFNWSDTEYNAYQQIMSAIGRLNAVQEIIMDQNVSEKHFSDFDKLLDISDSPDSPGIAFLEQQVQKRKEILEKETAKDPLSVKKSKWDAFKNSIKEPVETLKDLAIGINERLEVINPAIAFKMRNAEAKILRGNKLGQQVLSSFEGELKRVLKANKISEDAKQVFYLGLLNGDRKVINSIINLDRRLMKSFVRLEAVRTELEQRLLDVGALRPSQLIKGYTWHREVGDAEGLVKAMKRDAELSKAKKDGRNPDSKEWNLDDVELEIRDAMPELKKLGMTEQDARSFVVEKIMRTGKYPAVMRVAKGTKERRFPKVPTKYQQYYKDPFESMANHFEESNEVVAMRQLLGTTQFKRQLKEYNRKTKQLDNIPKGDKRDTLVADIYRLEVSMKKSQDSLADGVASYVDGLVQDGSITEEQRREVIKLITGRVTQVGITNKTAQHIRNFGLAGTLGHISNTMTQLKDGSLIVYRHGLRRTATSLFKTITAQNSISAKDYDLQRIMNEFRKGQGIDLNSIFKLTGFTQLDNMLKTVNLQSHIDSMRKQIKKSEDKFRAKYELKWGTKLTDKIIQDFKDDQLTSDVKNVAITELSRDVPVFLSEMPYAYNQGGNARIFYTLKSYAVKIMNIAYRDGIRKMTKGKGFERVQGAKNLMALSLILGLLGGGVEEIKDLMIGRETNYWDNVGDEVLNMFFMSRYSLDQVSKVGPSAALQGLLGVPAFNIIDGAVKVLSGSPEGMKYIPIPGAKELYYLGTGHGREKILRQNRESIFGTMRIEIQKNGKLSSGLKGRIKTYNRDIKALDKTELKPITFSTIKNNRKRYLKEAQEEGWFEKAIKSISPKDAFAGSVSKGSIESKQLQTLITKHAKRLGVNPVDAQKNLGKFAAIVGYAESRGDLTAKNPKSSATGLYQFVKDSIEPTLNRLARTTGWQPWMKELLKHKDVSKLNWYQQNLMFTASMLEAKGTDEFMKEILLSGDLQAMESAYYKFHHTDPDVPTVVRWNKSIKEVLGG